MSTQDTVDAGQVQPFAAILQQIGKGVAHARLSEALQQLTVAVRDTEKKGTLTLTLSVEPNKGTDTLIVSANCTVKLPQEQQASVFFATDDGNLTRSDPRQMDLPVRGVAKIGETA